MLDVSEQEKLVIFEGPEGDICVLPKCRHCGRYLKTGRLFTNIMGQVRFKEWICKKHGEVQPTRWWWRDG